MILPAVGQVESRHHNFHFKIDETYSGFDWQSSPEWQLLVSQYGPLDIDRTFRIDDPKLRLIYSLTCVHEVDTRHLEQELQHLEFIEYAEPVAEYALFYTPNDLQPQQWNLFQIQAEQAWNLGTGCNQVRVAIVDDAVLTSHQDLQAQIWTNTGEIPGNGMDDDGNTYIDDVNGWDAADNDNDPNPPASGISSSSWTHGTHVAGIAAAATDNSLGIASIGFNLEIIPVKTKLSSTSGGSLQATMEGVEYAIIAGADVINMSFGGVNSSQTWQNLIDYGHNQGIVFVAAAGNSNTSSLMYPASYDHVISVGATDMNDAKAGFSNYGSAIDVMAPGDGIHSTMAMSNTAYGDLSGTSMASPLVSGLCGLMLCFEPGMHPDSLELCLESTCENINGQNGAYLGQIGAGRVNAFQAMQCLDPSPNAFFSQDFEQICPGGAVQFQDESTGQNITSWSWSFPGGSPSSSTVQNPIVTYNNPGVYQVSLSVSSSYGSSTVTIDSVVIVAYPHATIEGDYTIVTGTSAALIFEFTGNAPWSVTYTDGSNVYVENGITDNPFYVTVSPTDTVSYWITAFSDTFCAGTFSDTANIFVVDPPTSLDCRFANIYGDQNNNGGNVIFDPVEEVFYAVMNTTGPIPSLLKLDRGGNIIWSRDLQSSTPVSGAWIIQATNNKDLLVLYTGNQNFMISRHDSSGNVLWSKLYDAPNRLFSPSFIPSYNDTYIVGCWYATGGVSDDVSAFKIDGSGNLMWSTRMNTGDDEIRSVESNGQGGILFAGWITVGDALFGEIDLNGNVLWKKRLTTSALAGMSIARMKDGGYIFCGYENSSSSVNGTDGYIMRLDSTLNVQWTRKFGDVNGSLPVRYVTTDNDDHIYLTARTNLAGSDELTVLKYDPNGNFIWAKRIDGLHTSQYSSLKISNTGSLPTDEIMLWTSAMNLPGSPGGTDFFFAVTDTSLDTCLAYNVYPSQTTASYAMVDWTPSFSTIPITVSPLVMTDIASVKMQVEICPATCDNDTCNLFIQGLNADTVLCQGDSMIFNLDSVYAQYVLWLVDGIAVGGAAQGTKYVFQSAGVKNVILFAWDSVCSVSDTFLVTVVPCAGNCGPSEFADTTICLNSGILLSAREGVSYRWSPANGVSDTSIQNPMFNPLSSTQYIVEVVDSAGCVFIDTFHIYLINCCGPIAAITGDSIVCLPGTADFNAWALGNGPLTFYWNFGPNAAPANSSLQDPPPVTFNQVGTDTVFLTVMDSCGGIVIPYLVWVFEKPSAQAGDDTSLCWNGNAVFHLGETPLWGQDYHWKPKEDLSDSLIADPLLITDTSVRYILETVDQVSGCWSEPDTVTITITDIPEANIIGDSVVCTGDQVDLTGQGGDEYTWYDGTTDSVLSFIPQINTQVTLIAAIDSCYDTTQMQVIVEDSNSISISGDTILCDGDSLFLEAMANGSVLWNTGQTTVGIFVSPSISSLYSASTQTTICPEASDSIFIHVLPQPVLNIDTTYFIPIGLSVQLNVAIPGTWSYNWTPSAGLSCSNCPNPVASPLTSTTYTISIPGPCPVEDTLRIVVDPSCIGFKVPSGFSPNGDGINDELRPLRLESVSKLEMFQIYNRWGELVYETDDASRGWDGMYKGMEQPISTFVYHIRYRCRDDIRNESGTVTLVR